MCFPALIINGFRVCVLRTSKLMSGAIPSARRRRCRPSTASAACWTMPSRSCPRERSSWDFPTTPMTGSCRGSRGRLHASSPMRARRSSPPPAGPRSVTTRRPKRRTSTIPTPPDGGMWSGSRTREASAQDSDWWGSTASAASVSGLSTAFGGRSMRCLKACTAWRRSCKDFVKKSRGPEKGDSRPAGGIDGF